MKFNSIILLLLVLISLVVIGSIITKVETSNEKVYEYTVSLNAPGEFNLLFGSHNSYLYREKISPETGKTEDVLVTSFPTLGDFMDGHWRGGGSVTSILNRAELSYRYLSQVVLFI